MTTSSGDRVRGLLAAGAILRPKSSVPSDEATEMLDARAYQHPALGDRRVVRLTQTTLAPAEDLTLEFLGFGGPQVVKSVGLARRQALGFPGWALVNDPDNAGYALAVVKEMERLARVAKSKPGNAKDGFEEIAGRLQRSVPQFLPSYFEQAGRFFVEAGNNSMAATMFGKARDAELAFSLAVDEDVRRDAFLEFAFAGALTARSLDDYGKQLANAYEPLVAFGHFRQLAVQRTLGGLPPWTGMLDGLHRLARAAGLDQRAEDERLLEELLDAPATALAPIGFWKPLRPVLLTLAAASPEVRGKLLNLFPKPGRGGSDLDGWWLQLLIDSGATASLTGTAGQVPAAAEPAGGPAAWLSRMISHLGRSWRDIDWSALFPLIDSMAERLRSDGLPVSCTPQRRFNQPADVIDQLLSLDVPVEPPLAGSQIDVNRWLAQPPSRRRSLEHLAADPDYGPALDRGVHSYLWDKSALPLLPVPGLRTALIRWLDDRARLLSGGGLPTLREELDRVTRAVTPEIVALNPVAAAKIRGVDVGAALGRTLRAGIFDELGWPALEQVERAMSASATQVSTSWPYAIVSDNAKAIVVGPDSVLLEHDLRLPPSNKRYGLPWFTFVDGQLLVTWTGQGGRFAYWSKQPAAVMEFEGAPAFYMGRGDVASIPIAAGGRSFGGRPLGAGDSKLHIVGPPFSDGTDWWVLQSRDDGSVRWRELDATTGQAGRTTVPPLLETDGDPDWELLPRSCRLVPVTDGLGAVSTAANGIAGHRVRVRRDGTTEVVGVDGTVFTAKLGEPQADWRGRLNVKAPDIIVRFPGDALARALYTGHDRLGRNMQLELWDPTGTFVSASAALGARRPNFAQGTPFVPPPVVWDSMRPRDLGGSTALRRLSDAAATRLLHSAAAESNEIRVRKTFVALEPEPLPKTRALLSEVAPDLTHASLVAGVLGVVQAAAWLQQTVAQAAADTPPTAAEAPTATTRLPDPTDRELGEALAGLTGARTWYGSGSAGATLEQIRVVSSWMTAAPAATTQQSSRRLRDRLRPTARQQTQAPAPTSLPASMVEWTGLIGRIEAVAYRAALPTTPEEQRLVLLALLDTWADSVFAGSGRKLRRLRATQTDSTGAPIGQATQSLLRTGENSYFIVGFAGAFVANQARRITVIEHAPAGRFASPPNMAVESADELSGRWSSKDIRAFSGLAHDRGRLQWDPQIMEAIQSETGLTRAEAALLAAGLPNLDRYEQNFLDKSTRELLELKVAEAAAARANLQKVPAQLRLDILAEAMPPDPSALWKEPLVAVGTRIGRAWAARFGRRIAIPEHLTAEAKKLAPHGITGHQLLEAVADPSAVHPLNADATWFVNDKGTLSAYTDAIEKEFSTAWLHAAARGAAWIAATLPVGDVLRTQAATVLDLVRQRLLNPGLLLGLTGLSPEQAASLQLDRLPTYKPPRSTAHPPARDAGAVVFVTGQWRTSVYVRPSVLAKNIDDPWLGAVVAAGEPNLHSPLGAIRFALSDGASSIVRRIRSTPVPAGCYEMNPEHGAPDIVEAVEAAHSLGHEAAVLYLQLLTLHEPTNKLVMTWNNWTASTHKKAAAELTELGLATSGKRARAGREVFLPGGWEPVSAPSLPLEAWKLPLYGLERTESGALIPPLGRVLPLQPVHELFASAWVRASSGDGPGLEATGPRAGERKRR
ncbi:MAG TPA: hypothetical protein VFJ85_16965 [Acidimicrobiales bacterium]|nr:hypothetical protein [Acidimicrobiales bacterium]